MAQDYAASVQGAVLRVTKLNSDGTLATGASACYVTEAFMRVSFTPEYETGDEVAEKNAQGAVCIAYKAPDTLKNVSIEVAICEPDPELTQLLVGGTLLTDSGKTVGYASPSVGVDANPNGVAIEVWSYAIAEGKRSSVNPYFQWVFPYVKVTPSGDRVIENGALANAFSGTGLGNSGYGTGPDGNWTFISDRPYQYARVASAPVGQKGFQAVA
jgi:hypothetical protein